MQIGIICIYNVNMIGILSIFGSLLVVLASAYWILRR